MLKLDRFDIAILKALVRDGRMTKSRLAAEINLSISPAWERVRRLEAAGVIRGYNASVNWSRVVQAARIIVEITLSRHTAADMQRFEDRVRRSPEVTQCDATGEGLDYVMHVVCRDINHYQRFMDCLLAEGLAIERYFTYVVTKVVKEGVDVVPAWVDPA
ncbi:AsnC family transcriptional regulator [Burkholderia sp. SJ98]|uniref:Lrp/AsnC family transcriptional regulator n=1 Tax=Caballeronia zhejiangensis TaxID=871203 RepID=UPI00025BB60F|nr:Lrp/AsnC family transcriptional regulator [Caballeronia zhejiangensis]EKS72451.1 AsnC family transcriptional regulator [Burkholderia sp. SJ98]